MQFHDAANIFPLAENDIDAIAESIRQEGLKVPIETLDGKILDGRTRWKACKKAGVKAKFREVKVDDPIAYVLALNLHRRHLTVSQAAMCAQRARAMYDRRAKDRMLAGKKKDPPDNCPEGDFGDARDQVGEQFGVSGKSVDRAAKVQKDGVPDVVQAVDAGKVSVNRAAVIASYPAGMQSALLDGKTGRKNHSPKATPAKPKEEPPEGVSRGVGIERANEAINCLIRIPKNDRLRKRGFQIVTDWIKRNQ